MEIQHLNKVQFAMVRQEMESLKEMMNEILEKRSAGNRELVTRSSEPREREEAINFGQ